jgi:glycerophosphoryl diester phosphodiesterase
VRRFLTLETEQQLTTLRDDSSLLDLIHGVSIEEALTDQRSVDWFDRKQLEMWAWTVDDPRRVRELVDLGVEGIATDNLALLELLQADAPK